MQFLLEAVLKLNTAGFNVDGVKAQVDGLKTSLGGVGDSAVNFDRVATSAGNFGRAMLPISAAATSVATGAVAIGASYEREFSKITGLVGIAAGEVEKMADATLSLGTATGRGPQELAQAMFTIQSAGLRGAEGMSALEIAAKSAAAGMGTTGDNARALTGALNAYKASGLTAAAAGDILAATARAGNFELAGLSKALGRVLPVASTLGVGLDQVGGAIALLTRNGTSAQESITQVRAVLNSMIAPSEATKTSLEAVGLSMADLRNTLATDGIVAALEQMWEAAGRNEEAFAKMIGSQEAVGAAFTLIGASAADIDQTFGAVANSAGVLNEAFDAAADTAGFKMEQALSSIKASLIGLGDAFLPAAASLASGIATMADGFNSLPAPIQSAAAGMLGLTAAAAPVALAASKAAQGLSALQVAAAASGKSLAGFAIGAAAPIAAVTAAVGLLGYAFIKYQDGVRDAQARVDAFTVAMGEVPNTMQNAAASVDELIVALGLIAPTANEAETALTGVAAALEQNFDGDKISKLNEYGLTFEELAPAVDLGAEALNEFGVASAAAEIASRGAADPSKAWADILRSELSPATLEATSAIIDSIEAGKLSANNAILLISSLERQAEAYAESSEQVKQSTVEQLKAGVASGQFAEDIGNTAIAAVEASTSYGEFVAALRDLGVAQVEALASSGNLDEAQAAIAISAIEAAGSIEEVVNIINEIPVAAEKVNDADRKFIAMGQAIAEAKDSTNELEDALATAFDEGLEGPQKMADELLKLQDVAEEKMELGVDADEAQRVVEDLATEITGITEEDWKAIIDGDASGFTEEAQRALLLAAEFTDQEITALLSGDATELNQTLILAGYQLGAFDETVVAASLGIDARQAFSVLAALALQLGQIGTAMQTIGGKAHVFDPITGQLRETTVASFRSTEGLTNVSAALDRIGTGESLSNLGSNARSAGGGARAAAEDFDEMTDAEKEAAEAAEEFTDAIEELEDAVSEVAEANQDLADSYDAVTDAISEAQDAIDAFNGVQKDTIEAQSDLYEALDDLTEQLGEANEEGAEFANTLDLTTEAGRENTKAIVDAVEAAQEYALAQIAAGVSAEEAGAGYRSTIETIIAMGEAMGLSAEETNALIESIAGLPDSILIEAEADLDPVTENLEELRQEIESITGETIELVIEAKGEQAREEMAQVLAEATGLTEAEIIATLSADSSPFTAEAAAVILKLGEIEGYEAIAQLDADDVGLRTKLLAVLVDLGAISETEAKARIRTDFGDSAVKIAEFNAELAKLRGESLARIRLEGALEALRDAEKLSAAINGIPNGDFQITSNIGDLIGQAETLLTGVKSATAPQDLQVSSNLAVTRAEADGLKTSADAATAPREMTVGSNIPAVTGEADALKASADAATAARTITVGSNLPAVTGEADNLARAADAATAARNLPISTNAGSARAEVEGFGSAADTATRARTATINVVATGVGSVAASIDNAARSRTASINVTRTETTIQKTISEGVPVGLIGTKSGGTSTAAAVSRPSGISAFTAASNLDIVPQRANTQQSFISTQTPPAGYPTGNQQLTIQVGGVSIVDGTGTPPETIKGMVNDGLKEFEQTMNRKLAANV